MASRYPLERLGGFQPRWALAELADCWTLFNSYD